MEVRVLLVELTLKRGDFFGGEFAQRGQEFVVTGLGIAARGEAVLIEEHAFLQVDHHIPVDAAQLKAQVIVVEEKVG